MRNALRMSACAAVAALSISAGSISAQQSGPAYDASATQAEEYDRQARSLLNDRTEWGRAASLFEKAAKDRGDDPQAAEDWRMAGMMAHYVGKNAKAREALERSAEVALEWGNVELAANSLIEAAWVARIQGDGADTIELVRRAERLASSPLLERAERTALMSKLSEPQPPSVPGS